MNHDQTASQLPAEHVHIDIKRDECVPVSKRMSFGALFLIGVAICVLIVAGAEWLGRVYG